jgi:phosphoadenosine phosphosulfate reductase
MDFKRCWGLFRKNNVPQNALHKQGFVSIGCAPCTRAITADENIRAGRWWWESSHKNVGYRSDS